MQFSEEMSAYLANTEARENDGRWTIRCMKGMWSVDAPTYSEAEKEAQHYFHQYYEDGEYT